MSDIIKKTMLAGLGLMSMTKEKADKLVNTLVKEGEMSKTEGSKLAKELVKKVEENKTLLEKKVETSVKKIMIKLDIPSRKEINELKRKIDTSQKKEKGE